MKGGFTSDWMEEFIAGAARAVFALSWADHQAARGKSLSGLDLSKEAPVNPLWAYVWAGQMVGHYEVINGTNIYAIAHRASMADGRDVDPELFGHFLANMALGTGASWFDDHKSFPLKTPYLEFDYHDEDED
jgi:hypothetical protein